MATRFELVLPVETSGRDEGAWRAALRAAGEEALAEIVAMEDWLSIYRPGSPIAQANARAAHEPVRLPPPVFDFLCLAREWSARTENTFDPTVGPLVRVWRELDSQSPEWPAWEAAARALVGWRHVELDPRERTIRFHQPGVRLDFGSIGKGWAIDRALTVLREAGVTRALLHGGTSTVMALGTPPGAAAWQIELVEVSGQNPAGDGGPRTVALVDAALSVSATWGRTQRDARGREQGHVLDPRTGEPVAGPHRAAVVGPTALLTDVLSTALLVSGPPLLPRLGEFGPGVHGWYD